MNAIRLMTCAVLLSSCAIVAHGENADTLDFNDAAWAKEAADRLARCAGTYRGAAEVLRRSGQEPSAQYAQQVGSGALFAAYLLLTSPAAVHANVLDGVDANVYIEALAWGTKRNFIMMDAQGEPLPEALRACTQTSALQSTVLRSSMVTPAVAEVRPAP